MRAHEFWVGIDVGGTFTDAVLFDASTGRLSWSKRPSTPDAPQAGVLDALGAFDALTPEHLTRIIHGVTIGTNAIIERRGAEVWVVTTRGFRDTLEIARTERRVLYNIKTLKPAPIVPRTRILEIDERVLHDGTVHCPLDGAEIDRVVGELSAAEARSVAVCLLHSYANPRHELAVVEAIRGALPHAFVCASSEVLPELREYERFSTTALNAYIGPRMQTYLQGLRGDLRQRRVEAPVFLMTSNGGVIGAARAQEFPVQTVLSGPAGGVAAAIELGRAIGNVNLITYDMGGTSTDVSLIEDLNPPLTAERQVAGLPNRTPQLEIETVGAGGGSIAWLDDGDILAVGPRSAGAQPGPAAYRRGGVEATVTDANLCLGRLSQATTLASTLTLDATAARQSIERLAGRIGDIGVDELAEGIVRIAVARMVSAIKEISITRGHDPRDFSLVAYGGAGPMHAAFIAEELEIQRVLVPPSPGNFSAFGCLGSDLRQTRVRSHRIDTRTGDFEDVEGAFQALENDARDALLADGLEDVALGVERELGMRYIGQSWELAVRVPNRTTSMAELIERFHAAHERRYGHADDQAAEIVSTWVTVVGSVRGPRLSQPPARGAAEPAVRRVCFAGQHIDTEIWSRDALSAGLTLTGPVLVEEMGALTVVPPAWSAQVGELGELRLSRQ